MLTLRVRSFCLVISLCFVAPNGYYLQEQENVGHGSCREAYNRLLKEEMLRYIDASGKPGSGIFGGNNLWFGSFSECTKLQKSRYCLTFLANATFDMGNNQTKIFQSLEWGACLPQECTEDNVKNNINFLLKNISGIAMKPLRRNNVKIKCADDPNYTTGTILTIILCGIMITACLIASSLDMIQAFQPENAKPDSSLASKTDISMETKLDEKAPLLGETKHEEQPEVHSWKVRLRPIALELLNCFSLIRNANNILSIKVGKNELTYLHGIRVLSLFWVILCHVFALIMRVPYLPTNNMDDVMTYVAHRPAAIVIYHTRYAVDTFFVLSGLLVVYSNLAKLDKYGGAINWMHFYIHRFCRLTPSYMFAILLVVNIQPLIGDGPWAFKLRETSCTDYWWTNLLYINNFHPSMAGEGCINYTWYLAVDMQLYVISPVLIIVLLRFGFQKFLALGTLVILASMTTTAILIERRDDYPINVNGVHKQNDFVNEIYSKPYCKAPPYIIGMILGCILSKHIGRDLYLKLHLVLILWALSIGTALALVYAPYNARKEDPHVWTHGEQVVFGTLQWFLWGLCIAWVIFACHFDYAGLIKSILGQKFWIPLSRINYAAYILHYPIASIVLINNETPLHFTTYTLVTSFLSVLVLVYAISFIFTTTVELPFANLEALFWRKRKRSSEKQSVPE